MIKEIDFDIIMIDKMAYIWTEREVDINIKSIYKNRLNLQLLIDKQTNFEFINSKKNELINIKNNIGNSIIYKNNNNVKKSNNQNKFNPNNSFQIVNYESISLISQTSFIQQSQNLLNTMNTELNNLKSEPEFRLKSGINNSPNQNKLFDFLPKIRSHSQTREKDNLNDTEINADIIRLDNEYENLKNNLKEINPYEYLFLYNL